MKFAEYSKLATENLIQAIETEKEKRIYASFILAEELGETAAEIRKPLYKGNYHEKRFSKEEIVGELGDVLWGIALLVKTYGIDPQKIEQKLTHVQPTNVTPINQSHIQKQEKIKMQLLELQIHIQQLCIPVEQDLLESYQRKEVTGVCKKKQAFKQKKGKIQEKTYQGKIIQAINSIEKFGSELGITLEEIMLTNICKVDSRYDKTGRREEEQEQEIS